MVGTYLGTEQYLCPERLVHPIELEIVAMLGYLEGLGLCVYHFWLPFYWAMYRNV